MPTKLKAPLHASSVSHGGEEYQVKGGYVSVPDHAVDPLLAHGYEKIAVESDEEEVNLDDDVEALNPHNMSKHELIAFLKTHKVSFPRQTNVGQLRKMVEEYLEENPEAAKPAEENEE
jgi:hypothetical protein